VLACLYQLSRCTQASPSFSACSTGPWMMPHGAWSILHLPQLKFWMSGHCYSMSGLWHKKYHDTHEVPLLFNALCTEELAT
jgi:hypothetical protein